MIEPPVRVLLVDDDDLMRAGLRAVLSSDETVNVVGEASDGRAAVTEVRRERPEVVLMDVRMPNLDGIAATRELLATSPDVKVVILTTFEQDDYIFGALTAGASGFLLKRTSPEELIAAIHAVAAVAALRELRALLAELGLELAEAKTRLVCLDREGEGFDFLGFHHRLVDSFRKPGTRWLARWPSARAMQAARQRICEITDRRRLLRPPEEIVVNLNRFLIGWGGYFRQGNSSRCFGKIDNYAFDRVARFLGERHQVRRPLKDGRGLLARRRDLIPRHLVGTIVHGSVHATR